MAREGISNVLLFCAVVFTAVTEGREHLNGLCPYRCHCRRTIVNCTNALNQNAINRSMPLPTNTKTLILDNNRISHINPNYFKGLDKLEVLSLKYNNISSVEAKTFTNVKNLEHLDLAANHIKTIDPDAFTDTPNLKLLSLAGNQLTQEAINASLQHLGNVEVLYLHR